MRAWLARVWDQQVGLDEYLPGTPHKGRSLLDAFPYHIWGRSNLPAAEAANSTAAEKKFREQDAVRRRQFPSCFEEACAYGNLQQVILLWSQGTVDIPTRQAVYEGNNASALMWASFKGHLPIVRFLVDHGAPLEAVNSLGHTALHWAITAGHADVARYLLDHGADPAHRDRQGFDAAFSAVQNDRLAILLMLTEDAAREGHVLSTSEHGLVFSQPATAQLRQQAAATVNPRTGKPYYLLDPAMRDVEGHTLMHWAAYRNSPATCQYLIDHWGYEVDATDKHGRTPLVWAAREGFAEVMEVLLSRGADRHKADSDQWTALQYARTRLHPEAVYVLENYPVESTAESAATVVAASSTKAPGVFGDGAQQEMQASAAVSDSARASLLAHQHSNAHSNAAKSRGGQRYVSVRDRRALGTFQMLRTHTMFVVMAVCGPLYLALTYVLMNVLPPIVSYFPFGIYFFKNVVWTALTQRPTQSSRSGPPPSSTRMMGIASNIAESARGTWLFRLRDPANLFVWVTFMVVQVMAWNALELPALFTSDTRGSGGTSPQTAPTSVVAGAVGQQSLWPATPASQPAPLVPYVGLSVLRLLTFQSNPLNEVGGWSAFTAPYTATAATATREERNAAALAYTRQAHSLVRWTLMLLILLTLFCAVLCKALARRSVMRSSEEGTLRTSPVWRIVASRQYKWLHPRFFFQERHMQFPLRAFYCHEQDVVVRGYDGYSSLLDAPIGRSNHLCFVVMLTAFTLSQLLMCTWGMQQMRALLQCPAQDPWYANAFFAFQSDEALAAAMAAKNAATTMVTNTTTAAAAAVAANGDTTTDLYALSTAVLSAAAPVISFSWLNTVLETLLHGLPCRQHQRLDEMTRTYLDAVAASTADGATPSTVARVVRRALYLIQYYLWPTRASALGVWVLHYSFLAIVSLGSIALRQWCGVWSGATRMELANPLAQGSDGELVTIFPKDPQQAQRVPPLNAEEERYYAEVCPDKARSLEALPVFGSRSIYAEGNGLMNILAFLLGRSGKRWTGAMSVSAHNAPVKTPMLM